MPRAGPRKVHRYRLEFKLKTVKLSQLKDVQVQAVADALEIHPFMLSKWRKEARDGVLRGRVSVPKAVKTPPARDVKRFQALKRAHALLQEAEEQVQPDCVEPVRLRPLRIMRRAADAQLLFGLVEQLTADQHGRVEPVCQREPRIHFQRALRRPQALTAPAHERQAQLRAPVVGLERDRSTCSGDRRDRVSVGILDEGEGAPGFAGRGIEPDGRVRVMSGEVQCGQIRWTSARVDSNRRWYTVASPTCPGA
jgi:transposase